METVQVEADSSRLIGALERILPQRGYRTLRSFDLPLATAMHHAQDCSACSEYGKGACNCRYAVLLVFANPPQTAPLETISIQGRGQCSTVTLLSPDGESELSAQFALLLVEALRSVGAPTG